jgi:alkaline phosphatase D
LLLLALLGGAAGAPVADLVDPLLLERIALGSCARQTLPQPIWTAIAATRPQLFLFLGDNVYADTVDMVEMRRDYEMLAAVPEFAAFRERVPILAMWDDHDYGANDAGAEYPKKVESKALLLDFFDEPAGSPRRRREGIYLAKVFGPAGRRVQIILLDGRTFRSPLERSPSPRYRYRPSTDPERTMLGEEQWTWLAEQLREPAEFRLVASGVQVLGYADGFESWKNLPLEQERLFRTIREAEASGVVFLSGDAHFTLLKRSDGGVGYPLYELTSSGLTHGNPLGAARPSPLAVHGPYGGRNFATIDFEWKDDPVLVLRARDEAGNPVFEHRIPRSELEIWRGP